MNVYKRGLEVIKSGVPLPEVVALPVKDEIVRLKSSVPNDNLSAIKDVEGRLEEQMGSLERMYRR